MRRISVLLACALVSSAVFVSGAPSPAAGARPPLRCAKKSLEGENFRLCTGLVLTKDRSSKLDVDVTLPAAGEGPFPLVVLLHGLGNTKTNFEVSFDADSTDTIEGTGGKYRFNNAWFASRGYAVLNYTARGFDGNTCANESIQSVDADPELYGDSPACLPQLVNVNHEVKDTQYLIGRLVDGSLLNVSAKAKASKVGVAGVSYGGGHTWMLSRKNVWRSPAGTRIKLAAAVPIIGWTDLMEAIIPNGRLRDDTVDLPDPELRIAQTRGVAKKSYINLFYTALNQTSLQPYKLPDYIKTWYERFVSGSEPYADAVSDDAARKIVTERSAYYIPQETVAHKTPTFALQGFTDQIFSAVQVVRMYNMLRFDEFDFPIKMYLGDWGHPNAQNKADETVYMLDAVNRWLDFYLKARGKAPKLDVEARTTECDSEQMGDLYRASSWDALKAGTIPLEAVSISGSLDSTAVDAHAAQLDPVPLSDRSEWGECRVTDSTVTDGNLADSVPVGAAGATMLGMPELSFVADPSAADMYVAARLWDVDPATGEQTLVTRGVYRLDSSGAPENVDFQLWGNAWNFEPGHEVKLELTANDEPSFKRSSTDGTIAISDVSLELPAADPSELVP